MSLQLVDCSFSGCFERLSVSLLDADQQRDAAVLVRKLVDLGEVLGFLRECVIMAQLLTTSGNDRIGALQDGLVDREKAVVESFETVLSRE